jgi:hypothetical protein
MSDIHMYRTLDVQEAEINRLRTENDTLRSTLLRVRRWGSPMIKGYIDGALAGVHTRSSDTLVDGEVGEVRGQEEEQA